ncbi:transglutaminase-like domain-containing protein [Flavobacterium oreochromis]|uniref:Transglutaminase-like domain-containing protein n=1 Tax=Flavobacterium oreochromis TaxID=2906078 RepID=A0ABW8PBN2_9FLAO
MKTLNIDKNKTTALIQLLDDPNTEIYNTVKKEILLLGSQLIPFLQEEFDHSNSDLQKYRLAELLDNFKLEHLKNEIVKWSQNETNNLLKGLFLIAKFGYPNLNENEVITTIQLLTQEIKPLVQNKSNYEIMQAMNTVILDDHKFGGNYKNYKGINNSFINKVIQNKVGNPIMICVLYLLVAQQLNIHLIGINSPKHFILAILNNNPTELSFYNDEPINQIDFFIDPFYQGVFYGNDRFNSILTEINFDLNEKIFLPATNLDIIKRVMKNLIYALHTTGEKKSATDLLKIVDLLS